MKHFLPAVCFYPTTVIFIDDNEAFLQNISLELNDEKTSFGFYNNPTAALKFLKNYRSDPLTQRCLQRSDEEEIGCPSMVVNLSKISQEMYNAKRFAQISTIVVDYAMPGLNGLELCANLAKMPFKKIMLTAKADEQLAVKAFNDGVIHRFIRKDEDNFYQVLNNAILEMQITYFHELSQPIVDNLTLAKINSNFLLDNIFRDFFDTVAKSLDFVEYYLIDDCGSFLFIDKNGAPKCLAVKNDTEIKNLISFAEYADADESIINPLRLRTHIPYFASESDLQTPPQMWKPFYYSATKLIGNNDTYYYSIISDSTRCKINKILSFVEFNQV